MSDFYPILYRAISKLADDDAQSRQELYEHARKFLISQLRQQQPHRSAPQIIREQAALERAIFLVENQLRLEQPQPQTEVTSARQAIVREAILDAPWPQGATTYQPPPIVDNKMPVVHAPEDPDVECDLRERKFGLPTVRRAPPSSKINDPKRPASRDPALVALVGIVALFSFTAVMGIPVAAIYVPRLLWLGEHLVDNPRLIVSTGAIFSVLLLVSLPIFGSKRKRTAFGLLWQLIYPMLRA